MERGVRELARAGIRLTMVTWNSQDFDLDYVKSLNGSGTSVVEAVEPPNERDNAWGSSWPQQMRSYMLKMYPRYKADQATKGITVLGPSFAKTRDSAPLLRSVFADAASYFDCGNTHDYSGCNPEGSTGGGWGLTLAEQAFPPDNIRNPFIDYALPNWLAGNVARNAGTLLGLHGAASLLPLVIGLVLSIAALTWMSRRQPASPTARPATLRTT